MPIRYLTVHFFRNMCRRQYRKKTVQISEQQFKEFTDNRHDIERFLSQNLGNDVKLFINKTEIEHNKVISPDNILKDMIARNESMQELVDRMNLKINY